MDSVAKPAVGSQGPAGTVPISAASACSRARRMAPPTASATGGGNALPICRYRAVFSPLNRQPHSSRQPCSLVTISQVSRGRRAGSAEAAGAWSATPSPSTPRSAQACLARVGPRSAPPCFFEPPTMVGPISLFHKRVAAVRDGEAGRIDDHVAGFLGAAGRGADGVRKRARTFYVAADVVGEIETYVDSSRSWAVREAQRKGRYERLPGLRVVTTVTRRANPSVRWRERDGASNECPLNDLTVQERMLLFTEGLHGPEPLGLWLNEKGMPFGVHSWEGVFRAANERCERVLTPANRIGLDPHQVFAPYATPHSARHSFALYMLVVLNMLMDQRYGLTEEERLDFRLLYGDPWFMVQQLLGHASRPPVELSCHRKSRRRTRTTLPMMSCPVMNIMVTNCDRRDGTDGAVSARCGRSSGCRSSRFAHSARRGAWAVGPQEPDGWSGSGIGAVSLVPEHVHRLTVPVPRICR
jgi:hypothetical protein